MGFVLGQAGPDDMWVRGEGSWLVDAQGNRCLDARSGIGNMNLGYSREDIAQAMYQQARELPFVCTMRWEQAVPVAVDYARALVDAAPAGITRVRFTHTGSAAVESAVLMARGYQRNVGRRKKRTVVALDGSFHGSTLTAMATGGQRILHRFFGPMPEGFAHVPLPDMASCPRCRDEASTDKTGTNRASTAEATCGSGVLAALRELDPDQLAAVFVEPVKGVSGVPLPDHFLRELREFCTAHGILLVFDEVFTAFGRTGAMFAAELSGVTPDVMCFAKAITAGYAALGAVAVTDEVYGAFDISSTSAFSHASSTDAHPVACAAALAALRVYQEEDVVAQGRAMGARLAHALSEALSGSPRLGAVRQLGAYVGLDLLDAEGRPAGMPMKRHLEARCRRAGLLIDYTPDTVMLIPPLTTPPQDVDFLAATLAEVVLAFRESDIDESTLRPATLRGHR